MTSIRLAEAQALATFARYIRPDWNQAGVVDAIGKCRNVALSEVAVALIRLAEDGSVKTPALLPTAGRHWARASRDETPTGPNLAHRDMCLEHPDTDRRECTRHEAPTPMPPGLRDQIRASVEHARLASRQDLNATRDRADARKASA